MAEEKEEVVKAILDEGHADALVCKTETENEKVCLNVGAEEHNEVASRKGMLDNNTYNLMEQLTNGNKSFWRIKNNFRNDASNNNEIQELWIFIEKDKQELAKLLTEKLQKRLYPPHFFRESTSFCL